MTAVVQRRCDGRVVGWAGERGLLDACGKAGCTVLLAAVRLDNPYRIFALAQQAWQAQRYPRLVAYTIHVQTTQGGKAEERHYHVWWNSGSNRIFVNPVSDEQLAHPYKPPPGVDVGILGVYVGSIGGPREGTGVRDDLIGIPDLSPNYSFGITPYVPAPPLTDADIVAQVRAEYHDEAPQKVAKLEQKQGGPKTIAIVVSSASRPYKITLAGIDRVNGHPDYHLALQPLRDPHKYRLRDIWIDTQSFATDKLRSAGNFVDGGTSGVPWLVTFQDVGGSHYIQKEVSEAPMNHWYDTVTLSFQNIAPASGVHNQFEGQPVVSPIREP